MHPTCIFLQLRQLGAGMPLLVGMSVCMCRSLTGVVRSLARVLRRGDASTAAAAITFVSSTGYISSLTVRALELDSPAMGQGPLRQSVYPKAYALV